MARKESTKQKREVIPTIIGAGITEKWYFTHLHIKYGVRMKMRPRFFGKETIFTLEKKLTEVLNDGGKAIIVFDADVSTWNDREKEKLLAMRAKYKNIQNVILCDSLPSIEYWFLLHYANTNRYFGTSKAVIAELTKYVKDFDKSETFFKNQKWVDDMSADNRLEQAYLRAKTFGTAGESYSNVWKSMSYLGIIKEKTEKQESTDTL